MFSASSFGPTYTVSAINSCDSSVDNFLFKQESAPGAAERLSILNALRADAGRLLAEYESNNPAGNRLQRHLLNCEHAFQQLEERYAETDLLRSDSFFVNSSMTVGLCNSYF